MDVDRAVAEEHRRRRFSWVAVVSSLFAHSLLMTILLLRLLRRLPEEKPPLPAEPPRVVARVQMLTPDEIRRLTGPDPVPTAPPPRTPPPPTAPPTPTPSGLKDKISIGPRGSRKAEEIVLRRDEPIPRQLQGDGVVGEDPGNREAQAAVPPVAGAPPPRDGVGGTAAPRRSILGAFEEKLQRRGTGLGVGPLDAAFDFNAEGADFTGWTEHLSRELYRNWIVPQAARMGLRGKVRIGCVIDRTGTVLRADILESSGAPALDGAARGALLGARLLRLPADYGPAQLTGIVTFSYN